MSSDPHASSASAATAAPRPAAPLQRLLWLVFVPLAAAALGTVVLVLAQVRNVHRNVQRMFEEHREVVQVRTLIDELSGIENWAEVLPHVPADARDLVVEDQRKHLAAARATLGRLWTADDPSRPEHDREEASFTARLRELLDRIGEQIGSTGDRHRDDLREARRIGTVLADLIEGENQRIGADLDRRSEGVVDLVLFLGIAIVLVLFGLAWMFAARVLRPLRQLHDGALRLAAGDRAVRVPPGRDDEIGTVAAAFNTMAGRLEASRRDLEARVEQRSKEVLRTAQLADLGTLAAGIAHEINNPLAAIVACAEGLLRKTRDDGLSPRAREYLEIMRTEAMRARDITARVLDFARQEPQRDALVRLDAIVREVATMLRHHADRVGVQLRTECEPGLPSIVGSGAEWRQVVYNLLKNAIDASPAAGSVRVTAVRVDDAVRLTVEDQGSGVPPELRERVFEPFFTTKAPGQGTGLGLAIAHRIVTGHDGRIEIADAPGGGGRFVVEVPLARRDAAPPPAAS